MGTAAAIRDPRELAAELSLPLLGTVPPPAAAEGPVSPRVPADAARRDSLKAVADRILAGPGPVEVIGLAGDLPPAERAELAGALAAVLAGERSTVLIDADLRGAHLAFEASSRAQEGLVDVLRYGVRSPRVVGPTGTPGLSLLPVGSGTVDVAGTYASDAAVPLFAELRRGGDLLVVNGPDPRDAGAAGRLLDLVGGWILVGSAAAVDSSSLLSLRDRLGRSRCVGVVVVAAGPPVTAPPAPRAPLASAVAAKAPARDLSARVEPEPASRVEPPRSSPLRVWGIGLAGLAAVVLAVVLLRPADRIERPEPSVERSAEPRVLPPTESTYTEQRVEEPPAPVSAPLTETLPQGACPAPDSPAPASVPRAPAAVAVPARATVEPPAPPAVQPSPASALAPAAPTPGGIWGVHLASMRTVAGAREEEARFTAKGFATVLREVEIEGKGRWVRVYVGPFADRNQASEAAARVRALGLQEYAQVQRLPAEESVGTGREDR
ncbi:MAG: SPOR domain-containing protein [Candidatus Eiseniibacteriota bacterium]